MVDSGTGGNFGYSQSVVSDNAPAKFVTVWLWQYEPALYIMQSQC